MYSDTSIMKKTFLEILFAALFFVGCSQTEKTPVYLDESAPIELRVKDALSRMTLDEKIKMVHAQSKFSSPGVPRLGIPELWTSDGPHGIRTEVLWDEWNSAGWTNDSITAFPALTCLAASFDPEISYLYGRSIGEEARFREKDVLLGPGVNMARTPLNGRNFEYMGEDPYLASRMVVPYIKGVQENGVAACVKHFALNNEETHRHTVNVDVDDRALYEIYLPAFKAAVQEAGSWSIMSSYNLFRGSHVCSDTLLTRRILRDEWGFDGAVISDWGGVHETPAAVYGGLDLEFGTWTDGLTMGATDTYDRYHLAAPFRQGILDGTYLESYLDEKVSNVLRLIFRTAMNTHKPFGSQCSEAHVAAARKIANSGMVLLRNEGGVLPVGADVKKLLVVGENAIKMMTVGGGSSSLKSDHEVLPLDGIIARAAQNGIEVSYQRGYVGDTSGAYNGVITGQNLSEDRDAATLIADACAAACEADMVIFVGGLNKARHQDCESRDRYELDLPYGQDAVIEALAAVNPRLAVVLVSGNPVAMPWVEQVPSIVEAWYCGSESGNALADILFGDVNPSGKLPFTFPVALSDSPAHQEGMSFPNDGDCYYEEGIFIGYRWFEHKGIKPLFAFGHGLSYTTFEIDALKARKSGNGVKVSCVVKNTGSVAGAEVVQVYVRDNECSVERPEKELKAFKKVFLQPGETAKITLDLGAEAFKYFDAENHRWTLEKGDFDILVGNSSDNIVATATVKY